MRFLVALLLVASSGMAADFHAGAARVDITPDGPLWLSGYASREHASTGVLHRLYGRALAIQDERRERVVVVSLDLIGIPRQLGDEVCARAAKLYELDRSQILLNASHTHTGPVVWPNLSTMYDLSEHEVHKLEAYSRRVTNTIVDLIGAALGAMEPAAISFGEGEAGFAANRRVIQPDGRVAFGVNPDGPVDHRIPVIRLMAEDRTLAVLFGYACHNTTLTGEHYQISGDYSGFAAAAIEKQLSGTVALFVALCGGDQNPDPRSEVPYAEAHGRSLATEVRRVMAADMQPVTGRLQSAFQLTDLRFRHHTREQFEAELESDNKAAVRRAREMLAAYDARRPVRSVPYPVQAIRFGDGPVLLALGGEVVVDYSLRAHREYPNTDLIVAGYSNDVMCYIPSVRVLREGGYEAEHSMIYYGQPGPFNEEVEETIFTTIGKVLGRVGVNE